MFSRFPNFALNLLELVSRVLLLLEKQRAHFQHTVLQ
jgi:hypothetical protein